MKRILVTGGGRRCCLLNPLQIFRLMSSEPMLTGPVGLGNPFETTIRQLAERMIEKVGSRSLLQFEQLPVDVPSRDVLD